MSIETTGANASSIVINNIAFIGFGEAANAFVRGWGNDRPWQCLAYDKKTDEEPKSRNQKLGEYNAANVGGCESADECASKASIVFSMVTADEALIAAHSVTGSILENSYYFDCNSCAVDTKKQAAAIITKAGGKYVDVAIMAPVLPLLHKTPVLISGPFAHEALNIMGQLDMSVISMGPDVGTASSIKMIRSVMIKGIEAIVAECVLSARKAGVEEIVLTSLDKTYPGIDWKTRTAYLFERMMVHGVRRAAEMREAALTIQQLGLDNAMTNATIEWQQTIGELQLDPGEKNYRSRADAILAALDKTTNREK